MTVTEVIATLPKQHPVFLTVFAAILGLMVGSFCNVVIYRLPRHCLSIVKPGSHCPKCETPLAWFDNIPVFAWAIWLRAKCRHCKAPIHWRYPMVEALVGGWFVLLAWKILIVPGGAPIPLDSGWPSAATPEHWALFFIWACAGATLLVASWIDAQMTIIPDSISLGGSAAIALLAPLAPLIHTWGIPEGRYDWIDAAFFFDIDAMWLSAWTTTLCLMAISAAALWTIGLLGYVVASKEALREGGGMGLGDVKIIMLLAGLLGWQKLIMAFLVATLLGTIIGFPKLWAKWRGKEGATTAISFGPFLAAGTVIAMILAQPMYEAMEWYIDALSYAFE